jgi:tRNA modification GTPase
VALLGAPNAGKSSLFNCLVQADAALVSPIAGTTRDYVSHVARFGDLDCLLIDTAGLEDAPRDEIQVAAQALSQQSQRQADLGLWCCDAAAEIIAPPHEFDPARTLRVLTKWDQADAAEIPSGWLPTSARTGEGIAELRAALAAALGERSQGDIVPATGVRCRSSLRGASQALAEAQAALARGTGEEVVAAELRVALDELGQVLGAVYTDDILDRIFSRFCIGK